MKQATKHNLLDQVHRIKSYLSRLECDIFELMEEDE